MALIVLMGCRGLLGAQDRTVLFDVTDTGVSKPVSTWGLDTAWYNPDHIRRGVIFMGAERVDTVRISFTPTSALVAGDLQADEITLLNQRLDLVDLTGPNTTVCINEDSPSVDASFKGVGGYIDPVAWAALIEATTIRAQARGRIVESVAPFNETDFYRPERLADKTTFKNTAIELNAKPLFNTIRISGGNTLNTDEATPWYDFIEPELDEGNTHQLAGNFGNYAAFFTHVNANGDHASNDELHNVMEAMVGAEYGLETGIWWGTAERARGEFVKASDGQRLGYAEHRNNWTAASVYRAPNGAVQGFVGESERQALPATYRFFSKDRDVFYDGDGPRRDYTVTTTGGPGYQTPAHRNAETVVNITWGDDIQPVINGRYIVVNRASLRVMQVSGASTNAGANVQVFFYVNDDYQHWDIVPLPNSNGGDYSYHSIKAAHSGKPIDVENFSYADGGNVFQWDDANGVNQHWFLDYAGNGYFYIRSRWSGKYLEAASTANTANVQQGDGPGGNLQQWRLIPVGNLVEFTAPAPPDGLQATPNAVSIGLTWEANTEPDFAGYTVLRSTNSGGPYNTIARGLTTPSFTDKSANTPDTFFYVVKATDDSMNTSGASGEASARPTLNPALVAHHSFDSDLQDGSVNANHPIITQGSPGIVPGTIGSAVDFNGANQFTMLPANLLRGVTDFTIAVWVNWDGGGDWQRIFDFGNDTAENMFLTPRSGDGTLRFAITTNGGGAEQRLNGAALPIGQWRHVAVTRQGNTAKLYVSGAVVNTTTMTISPASFDPALNYLGDSQYENDPLFNGQLDELYIYNHALTDLEIVNLMNNQPPPPGLPTTLHSLVSAGAMEMSWPTEHLGSRLESNSVSLLAPSQWFTVPGSTATNLMNFPINPASANVYFRLVYP